MTLMRGLRLHSGERSSIAQKRTLNVGSLLPSMAVSDQASVDGKLEEFSCLRLHLQCCIPLISSLLVVVVIFQRLAAASVGNSRRMVRKGVIILATLLRSV